MAGTVGVEPTLRGLEALVLAVIRDPLESNISHRIPAARDHNNLQSLVASLRCYLSWRWLGLLTPNALVLRTGLEPAITTLRGWGLSR